MLVLGSCELEAPDAVLYFFGRPAFSPRLRKPEQERDDVCLIRADQLDKR